VLEITFELARWLWTSSSMHRNTRWACETKSRV